MSLEQAFRRCSLHYSLRRRRRPADTISKIFPESVSSSRPGIRTNEQRASLNALRHQLGADRKAAPDCVRRRFGMEHALSPGGEYVVGNRCGSIDGTPARPHNVGVERWLLGIAAAETSTEPSGELCQASRCLYENSPNPPHVSENLRHFQNCKSAHGPGLPHGSTWTLPTCKRLSQGVQRGSRFSVLPVFSCLPMFVQIDPPEEPSMKTKPTVMLLVGMLLLLFASSANAEMRKWTCVDGTTFEAEFVGWEPHKGVHLKGADGKEIRVTIDNLIPQDRKYVREHAEPGKSEAEKKPATKETPVRSDQPNAEMRKWTHKNGKQFDAEFVKFERHDDGAKIVTVRKPDGTEMDVHVLGLSEDDQKYVNQMTKGKKQSTEQPVASSGQKVGEVPSVAGNWKDEWGALVTIKQHENTLNVHGHFKDESHWHGNGSVSKDGEITVNVVYTLPADKKSESFTAHISPDGKTLQGVWKWDGGEKKFALTLDTGGGDVVAKPHRKKPRAEKPDVANTVSTNPSTSPSSKPAESPEESLPPPRFSPQLAAALEKVSQPRYAEIHFSPRGNFLQGGLMSVNYTVRFADLWQVSTGEKKNPKNTDCDYFSLPLAFSPDEKSLACVDGQLLRIWDLTATPASLVCSVAIPPKGISDRFGWLDNDTILSVLETCAIFHREASGRFAAQPELIELPHHRDIIGFSAARKCVLLANGNDKRVFDLFTKATVAEPAFEQKSVWLQFSPDGAVLTEFGVNRHDARNLSLGVGTDGITFWDTKTWQKIAMVPEADQGAAGVTTVARACFSPNSQFVATTRTTAVQTATRRLQNSIIGIWDLRRGRLLHEISVPGYLPEEDGKDMWFDLAGKTLYVRGGGHVLQSWDVASGEARLRFSWKASVNQLQSEAEGPHFAALSPDGQTMVVESRLAGQPNWTLTAWNMGEFARMQEVIAEGDRQWEAGNKSKAAEKYQSVMSNSLAARIRFGGQQEPASPRLHGDHNLHRQSSTIPQATPNSATRLWSRCIDAYAEKGDSEKARKVLEDAAGKQLGVPSPETEPGKKFLADYQNAIAEANRHQSAERNAALQKQAEEERAQNKKDRVPAITLTRKQFIEKIQRKMSRGVINEMVANAVFENNSFQDSFGDPDKDLALDNIYHLISYRCSDGVIVLKVTSVEGTLVVTEINQL